MTSHLISRRKVTNLLVPLALLLCAPSLPAHPSHWNTSSSADLLHLLTQPSHWAGPLVIAALLAVLHRLHERRARRSSQRRSSRHD